MYFNEDFDLTELQALTAIQKRIAYAKENLPQLGAGSSRAVFDLGNNTVLKLAKNGKGVAQNESEYDVMSNSNSDYVPQAIDVDDNGYWLVAEKVLPIKEAQFKTYTGVSFADFQTYIRWKIEEMQYRNPKIIKSFERAAKALPNFNDLEENNFITDIAKIGRGLGFSIRRYCKNLKLGV